MHSNEKEVSHLSGAVIYCLVVNEVFSSLLKHGLAFLDVPGTEKINASQYKIVQFVLLFMNFSFVLW